MSNALAIASVTAVIKDLLDNAVIDHYVNTAVGGPITVTAQSPSKITVGAGEVPQLNVFLYHVTPNQGWRNVGLPSRAERGEQMSNPPLALDLYYLITAYGKESFEAEILLGYAMQLLHENPVLSRNDIRKALVGTDGNPSPIDSQILPPSLEALKASDLAGQAEMIKITPLVMSTEEMSKLWSALMANYRPSVAYQVSVVLIESAKQTKSHLPVLTIGKNNSGIKSQTDLISLYPVLKEVAAINGQRTVKPGDALSIRGSNIVPGNVKLRFNNSRLKTSLSIDAQASEEEISFILPKDLDTPDPSNGSPAPSTLWPAGIYTVSAKFESETEQVTTNDLPMVLSPILSKIDASNKADLKATVTPMIRADQRVSLFLGSHEIPSKPLDYGTYVPRFDAREVPTGRYLARIRVDGVDNQFINLSSEPPTFQGLTVELP
jgi:hypothetical protein